MFFISLSIVFLCSSTSHSPGLSIEPFVASVFSRASFIACLLASTDNLSYSSSERKSDDSFADSSRTGASCGFSEISDAACGSSGTTGASCPLSDSSFVSCSEFPNDSSTLVSSAVSSCGCPMFGASGVASSETSSCCCSSSFGVRLL